MKLVIKIDLDNDAFEECGYEEVQRILEDLCSRLPDPLRETNRDIVLHDIDGNCVGMARIS